MSCVLAPRGKNSLLELVEMVSLFLGRFAVIVFGLCCSCSSFRLICVCLDERLYEAAQAFLFKAAKSGLGVSEPLAS